MIYEKFEEKYRKIPYPRKEDYPDKEKLKGARIEYHNSCELVNEEFKKALIKEYGIEGHPKAKQVFNLAWSEGHSAGYSEVEHYFSEFVDLII